jgi:hypothetical protein
MVIESPVVTVPSHRKMPLLHPASVVVVMQGRCLMRLARRKPWRPDVSIHY